MMNDYIDAAVKNIDTHIAAQVKTLTAARGTMPNAAGLNDLIEAKKNLLAMKGVVKKAPEVSVEGLTCEHCGTTGLTKAMYGRWHGDKCSKK
jgi:hypothetical protein